MRIVESYARLVNIEGKWGDAPISDFSLDDGRGLLRKIEWCGRISHRSEDSQTQDSWERFIRAVVLQHGDWSIVEHASASVDMLVDRGITHEIVRHRLFSFTQESTRFVNYEKRDGKGEYKNPAAFIEPQGLDEVAAGHWRYTVDTAERGYREMIAAGSAPQIARSIFPNALASRIIVTGNLRNWRHFLLMRTTKETHPQMRQVAIPLLAEFQSKIPILFEDIEPNARQVANVAKGR